MQDISVIYFSRVTLVPGMGTRDHTHDYWHFSFARSGVCRDTNNSLKTGPFCDCIPAGQLHRGVFFEQQCDAINVMFFVNNESLHRKLEMFPFRQLTLNDEHGDFFFTLLDNLLNQVCELSGSEPLVSASFSYFLYLFMEHYSPKPYNPSFDAPLVNQGIRYIKENYMKPIMVKDVAQCIQRSENHTSSLIRKAVGMPLTEYINKIRIENACSQLAYSSTDIEEVAKQCGFASTRHFSRVFKSVVGTTPHRFRTSHRVEDMYFVGDREEYNTPYNSPNFTYIPSARKRMDWKTPWDYFEQMQKK